MAGFAKIAFTDNVKALQERATSRAAYARMESRETGDVSLGPDEIEFIETRDSFYLSSVNSEGWPYIQHRGGPRGFLQAIDPTHLTFTEYAGNKQYVTQGNLATNDRVALFLMDYPSKSRLKILGHAKFVDGRFAIEVVAWDWNCNQHITPRYTIEEIESMVKQ